MQLNGIEGQLGFWESQKRGIFLLPFTQFYCDLEIKLKNLNRWNCVIVHISFNGIEIEPFLSPVGEVPPTLPIQWDLEDRYSTSNDNFYYGPMMFLRRSTTGNNDVI